MSVRLLITTDTGFETVLLDELSELCRIQRVLRMFSGRILVEVPRSDALNVLRSRIANNVYVLLEYFEDVHSLDDIYRRVYEVEIENIIEPNESFAIRPERVGEHDFTSIDIGRVAGQAVIDRYLSAKGTRLKVNLDEPDVEIYVELNYDKLLIALPLTRSSLHRRGYRVFNHPAALKTTIASAMIRMSGWTPETGLYDPMCGGGTVLIEAGLVVKGMEIACLKRRELESVPTNRRIFPELREFLEDLCSREVSIDVRKMLVGTELNPRFAEGAVLNAKNAGVDDLVLIVVGDCMKRMKVLKIVEKEYGVEFRTAVFNPPYGHRMRRENLYELYLGVLRALKNYGFERVVFITSAIEVAEKALLRIEPEDVRKHYVIHGTLPSYVYVVKF